MAHFRHQSRGQAASPGLLLTCRRERSWTITVNTVKVCFFFFGFFSSKTESGTRMEIVKQVCVLSQMGNAYQNSQLIK